MKNGAASPGAQAAAAEFLQRVERSRSNFEPDTTPLTPLQEKLVELIEQAFAGVQCLNEPYVLLCGEALQSQVKTKGHGENGKIKCDTMRAQKRCSPEEEMV